MQNSQLALTGLSLTNSYYARNYKNILFSVPKWMIFDASVDYNIEDLP